MDSHRSRRDFLTGMSAAGIAGALPGVALAQQPLETSTVRFASAPGICIAPQYVAEALLRADGFTDLRFEKVESGLSAVAETASGNLDFIIEFGTAFVLSVDHGAPIKVLSGVHIGCYELFARADIKGIPDLKGRSVGAGWNLGSDPHIFISAMATYVGLDPARDITWVTSETPALDLFAEGKIDAFLSFPPEAQALRAKGVGHVIVNSMLDRPWSQYFCCMLAANTAYAEAHPEATKRVVRAILKATDICVAEPERVARLLVDDGHTGDYAFALQALKEIPFEPWRDYDPEDTLRFFALRLHEAGMIRTSPQEIIARGTDWSFFNQIKRELKA